MLGTAPAAGSVSGDRNVLAAGGGKSVERRAALFILGIDHSRLLDQWPPDVLAPRQDRIVQRPQAIPSWLLNVRTRLKQNGIPFRQARKAAATLIG